MLYKVDTKEGQITLDRYAAAQIVEEQISQFRGKVWITNSKGAIGGFMNRLSGRSDLDDLEISMDKDGIFVRVYLVIRFGVSIRMVSERLLADIRKALEDCTELPVSEVNLVVTGTLSKHIARRNIEIRG